MNESGNEAAVKPDVIVEQRKTAWLPVYEKPKYITTTQVDVDAAGVPVWVTEVTENHG